MPPERALGPKVSAAAFHGKLSKLQRYLEEEDGTLLDCPSVDYADQDGMTPLHAACQEGHDQCVELLLRAGARVDSTSKHGLTPLIIACENGRRGCAHLLVKATAAIDKAEHLNAATALHGACLNGAVECVELLLQARALLNVVDTDGATPLILAAHHGHIECVKLLVGAGADELVEYEGKIAFELAEDAGHESCAKVLERKATGRKPCSREGEASEELGEEQGEEDRPPFIEEPPPPPPPPPLPQPGVNKMLSELSKQVKAVGLKAADVIAAKQQGLEVESKRHEDATARAEAEANAIAAAPRASSDAKEKANMLFAKGKITEAADLYERALKLDEAEAEATNADSEMGHVIGGRAGRGAEPKARAVLHSNLAACRLKQRRWRDAVSECDIACALYPCFTKALFRRAQAKRHLCDPEGALQDAQLAYKALCDAGGGKPIGEAGKQMGAEMERFVDSVQQEAKAEAEGKERRSQEAKAEAEGKERRSQEAKAEAEGKERRECEEHGITLGLGAFSDAKSKTVSCHYALQGDKTQDYLWFVRQQCARGFKGLQFERKEPFTAPNGYTARHGVIRLSDFDPDPEVDRKRDVFGILEGECTIRHHGGRRALFFDLTLEVPWRAVLGEGPEREEQLGGKTRLWNVNHYNAFHDWKHLHLRSTHAAESGPAQDAISAMLAPAALALIKCKLQEVLGKLMYDKIDPAMLDPPKKPQAGSRSWGKGTVDYSKWDLLDEDGDEDEDEVQRVTEVPRAAGRPDQYLPEPMARGSKGRPCTGDK